MSPDSQQAVQTLMQAFAKGVPISLRLARASGYDIYVLQQYMDIAAPQLESLSDYKPLLAWLREHKDTHVSCKQDLKPYTDVLRVMQFYVNVNEPNDAIYAVQTVEVYVSRDGKYIVTVSEEPDKLKQDRYSGHKERLSQVIECVTAGDLEQILRPMQLQVDKYSEYDARFRVASPLLVIAKGLHGACESRCREIQRQALVFEGVLRVMDATMKL